MSRTATTAIATSRRVAGAGGVDLAVVDATDRMAGRIASFTSMSGPCLDHAGWWIRDRLSSLRPSAIRQLAVQGMHAWSMAAFHLPGAPRFWRLGGGRIVHWALVALGELPPDSRPSPTQGRAGANGVRLYRANVLGRVGQPCERRTDVTAVEVVAVLALLWVSGTAFLLRHDPTRSGRPTVAAFRRAGREGLLPTFGELLRMVPRYLQPSYHPLQDGSTSEAVAYLARSPAAQTARTT